MKAESNTTMTMRVKEGKKKALLELADKNKWSLNKYLNEIIDAHLKKQKK